MALPTSCILDSNGNDVTGQVTSGSLSGLLTAVNNVIPSLAGGGHTSVADYNTLAQSLADTVNNLLAKGSTTATPPYQCGRCPLFTSTRPDLASWCCGESERQSNLDAQPTRGDRS